jgi:hypothetical protein
MQKSIVLIFTASILFLAGCCTTPRAAKWEYKVVFLPNGDANTSSTQENRNLQQTSFNDLGQDGWMLVSEDGGTFYFKRRVK